MSEENKQRQVAEQAHEQACEENRVVAIVDGKPHQVYPGPYVSPRSRKSSMPPLRTFSKRWWTAS